MLHKNLNEFFKSIPKNKRIMCLDMGEKQVGIAFSDKTQLIATAHSVYRRHNISKDLGYFNRMLKENEAGSIVVGLPLEMDGEENRLISKPIYGEKSLGEVHASTTEYSNVFDEHRKTSTTKLPLEIEFRKKFNEWCKKITQFAHKIVKKYKVNMYLQDESFSTSIATYALKITGISITKSKEVDDKIAACIILQRTLDKINTIKKTAY
ncbi:MAG: Holliday junction resolvase RuvX [Wolbachia sp.]|nr:Holliday junction resolvase RuvX [Wolbachia sp.]MDD9336293.1 Holliday junction resolvase RuvX [Wolbachia sp.]